MLPLYEWRCRCLLLQSARNAVGILRSRRRQRTSGAGPARLAPSRHIASTCASVAIYRSGTFRRGSQKHLLLAGPDRVRRAVGGINRLPAFLCGVTDERVTVG